MEGYLWCRCVDVVLVYSSKPRGRNEKNPYTLREKTEKKFCSMKEDSTCKNNWSLLLADYLFNILTFICKDQIYTNAFLICNKTMSKLKHHAVGVIPTTWEFVSLSPYVKSLIFFMKKMRNIIFKGIFFRSIYCTEMLMSALFLLKLEVLKKMEAQIQNHGIKLSLRFWLYFCLGVTKCY